MLKAIVTVLFLVSTALGQSASDGLFVVRHVKKSGSPLTPAQMREAEKLYQSACTVVQRDFHGPNELHPRFTVLLGAERDEIHGKSELWLKEWNPAMFTQGVVVLAFEQVLTDNLTRQLAKRALQYAAATVDVAALKQNH